MPDVRWLGTRKQTPTAADVAVVDAITFPVVDGINGLITAIATKISSGVLERPPVTSDVTYWSVETLLIRIYVTSGGFLLNIIIWKKLLQVR